MGCAERATGIVLPYSPAFLFSLAVLDQLVASAHARQRTSIVVGVADLIDLLMTHGVTE